MELNEKNKRYEVLKVIATILVVLAHITRMYTGIGIVKPLNNSISLNYLTKFIYSFHMPLFVSISGAIYYYVKVKLNRYNNNNKFLINKFKRLLIPYVAFGILYVAPVMILCEFTNLSFIEYIFKGILLSLDSRHLWYVLMLFNVFIIFQFGNKLINKYSNHFILIFVVFNIISYWLPNYFQINNTFKYIIYFYFGYLFEKNKHKFKINSNFCFIITFILLIIFNYLSLLNINFKINIFLNLINAILGIAFIYIISEYVNKEKIINSKTYKAIEKNSFGIYLFHPMIIYVFYYFLGGENISPYVLTIIVFVITMLLSNLFTLLIRYLKLNILIGENN